jgi:hypothetical protein
VWVLATQSDIRSRGPAGWIALVVASFSSRWHIAGLCSRTTIFSSFLKPIYLCLQFDLEAAGYPAPMHPSAYSHVLFLVHMPDTELWRWSYMERSQLWRHPPDQPARFSKSVATVRQCRPSSMLQYRTDIS